MVVVRESPRARLSPDKATTQWPPKSPFQALLSSPSGRKKWQDHQGRGEERSPSPSPRRKPLGSAKALRALLDEAGEDDGGGDEDEDEDEDVETLQLQMQMIQAKLKMKKLRKQGQRAGPSTDEKENRGGPASRAATHPVSPRKATKPTISQAQQPRSNIEVPLSPTRDRSTAPQEHLSPARKKLGIDVQAKAQNVSLKRARDGTQLKRSDSQRSAINLDASKPKSFSERLQASKQEAQNHEDKYERIERSRSKGFGTLLTNTERSGADDGRSGFQEKTERQRPSSTRDTTSIRQPTTAAAVSRSASTRSSQANTQRKTTQPATFRTPADALAEKQWAGHSGRPSDAQAGNEPPSSNYDPLSEVHLSKRHISHVDVARAMDGKEIYTIPRLFKEVVSPHYDPPDCEDDFVVFAVLASKSSPFAQKAAHRTSDEKKPQDDAEAPRNKFMVLKLTDLKYELDCFLFGTGFDQFWKLTPGTLLAILNPAIMPPKNNHHSGHFSLKLSSSEDCVMEIGMARDLGYCTSVKKDGEQCGSWIDKRHTEICEFHLNLFIDKQRKHRMEVNGMWRGTGDVDLNKAKSQSREAGGWDKQMKKKRGVTNHREYGTLYSVPTGRPGKSAASLLDAEDMDALHDMTKEEASRKRIAEAQRERDLRKRLGEMGSGLGAEYLKATDTDPSSTSKSSTKFSADGATARSALFDKPKASDLGLLGNKASATHLSPAKDRKHHFGTAAISSSGRDAMGWGGARKPGLLPETNRRLSPERGQTKLSAVRPPAVRARSSRDDGSLSPTKKRARFALEKGIREPGRESLGEDLNSLATPAFTGADDDDDDLDIV